eukprot:GHVU01060395.1.p1 GENE.GHVU01060395.1~~GHVU01060395.1.p1  ORF type:complete len:131 (+),score=3.10 GHVU01060395.1:259-651(+)
MALGPKTMKPAVEIPAGDVEGWPRTKCVLLRTLTKKEGGSSISVNTNRKRGSGPAEGALLEAGGAKPDHSHGSCIEGLWSRKHKQALEYGQKTYSGPSDSTLRREIPRDSSLDNDPFDLAVARRRRHRLW